MRRSTAPISLDLDNKWSYLMTHGDSSWTRYPSYLPKLVPRVLDFLDQRDLKITFFIVGRDATEEAHRDLFAEVVRQGHRIANHSFDHKPWLHRFSDMEIADELERSETAIEEATGVRPKGFRGPGFSLSDEVLRQLADRDYMYDATAFPNILNPLSRAYYFRTTKLSREEREQRAELFGTLGAAFRPNKPFAWKIGPTLELTEIPVTTFPGLRTPIHLSYLAYLGAKALPVASAYFRAALTLCRLTGNAPSMLLHPLDFLGSDDDKDLGFFPGMNLPSARKLELAHHFLDQLQNSFTVIPIEDYVMGLTTTRRRVPDYSA
jgi:peptidoglycan-N-acetylglucosamine deacetylase